MSTALDEIRRILPKVDLVIQVLDARIPFTSDNPVVAGLRGERPCVQIVNKSDLAEPGVTRDWLSAFDNTPGIRAIEHNSKLQGLLPAVVGAASSLVKRRGTGPMTALILGIPNVGKSTVINRMAGKNITLTGDKPAVTQMQQRVQVGPDLLLIDTPGMLWGRLEPVEVAYKLVLTGAIGERAVDHLEVGLFAARWLRERRPKAITGFYGIAELPADELLLIEAIGRRRGFLVKGGAVDMERASDRLLHDLRDGAFGRYSLERPGEQVRAAPPAS
jgi:ribosome biogenesis GTPase A